MENLIEKVRDLVLPILDSYSVELVDLEVKGREGSRSVKVFIDTPGGIDLETCTRISRTLSEQLDINDTISGNYRLEVSSPGVSRPLRNSRDFARNTGREVEVVFEVLDGQTQLRGKLVDVTEEAIQVQTKKELRTIPVSTIKHGKVCLPW